MCWLSFAPNNTYNAHGSFGTTYFPARRPDQVQLLIKSLLTAQPPVPFIFATAGAPAGLVDETSAILQAEKDSALGLICGFAPQMFILNHAATGFFLVGASITCSHPGNNFPAVHNSHMEAPTPLQNLFSPKSL